MRRILVLLLFAVLIAPLQASLASAQESSYELAQAERSGTTRYVVRPGDTIYSIARNVGVPVSTILELNHND